MRVRIHMGMGMCEYISEKTKDSYGTKIEKKYGYEWK